MTRFGKVESLWSKVWRAISGGAFQRRPNAEAKDMNERLNYEDRDNVDVTEFVKESQKAGDPKQLASEFDREFERTLSDHKMSREQLEVTVSV